MYLFCWVIWSMIYWTVSEGEWWNKYGRKVICLLMVHFTINHNFPVVINCWNTFWIILFTGVWFWGGNCSLVEAKPWPSFIQNYPIFYPNNEIWITIYKSAFIKSAVWNRTHVPPQWIRDKWPICISRWVRVRWQCSTAPTEIPFIN